MSNRTERLLPNGVPRWIRCYDNGGESADRYTVCFTGKAGAADGEYCYRAMSEYPFHPQGVGMWGASKSRHCDLQELQATAFIVGCIERIKSEQPLTDAEKRHGCDLAESHGA